MPTTPSSVKKRPKNRSRGKSSSSPAPLKVCTATAAREKEYYASVAEKDFQQQFVQIGRAHGWLIFHDYDSRKNEPGFPDNVCVHPLGDFFVAELKTEKGRLRSAQKVWLAAWCAAGIENHVWRPSDIDTIIDRFQHIHSRLVR